MADELVPPIAPVETPPTTQPLPPPTPPPAVTPTTEPPATPPVDEFDESAIDPEVRDYKPPEAKPPSEDDVLDAEDEARLTRIIEKKYGGDVEGIKRQMTVDTYFTEHKELSKYKGAAQKYLNHPLYSGLPIANIVAIVSSKDQQKLGAAKEREAQRRIAETATPGTSVRPTSVSGTDWSTASKELFEAQKAKVLGRQGV